MAFYWSPRLQLAWKSALRSFHRFVFRQFSWVCIRGTLWVNHLWTPLLPAPLFFLLEVAPSILQNAVTLASRLQQTAPFHPLASRPLDPHPMLFFRISHLSLPLTFALESQTNAVSETGAKAHSDVTVWLSRTLGQERRVCCNVTLVAVRTQWSQFTNKKYIFFSVPLLSRLKLQLHANITRHLHSVMTKTSMLILFLFWFWNAHPPYMPFQPALWLSLCLSLLACNASWVELWSKHQDKKAMEKQQSKTLFTHQKKKRKEKRLGALLTFSHPLLFASPNSPVS